MNPFRGRGDLEITLMDTLTPETPRWRAGAGIGAEGQSTPRARGGSFTSATDGRTEYPGMRQDPAQVALQIYDDPPAIS
jgi:hypothetical protein